jgi:hypothetical protein
MDPKPNAMYCFNEGESIFDAQGDRLPEQPVDIIGENNAHRQDWNDARQPDPTAVEPGERTGILSGKPEPGDRQSHDADKLKPDPPESKRKRQAAQLHRIPA